jgi:hypothetical protein
MIDFTDKRGTMGTSLVSTRRVYLRPSHETVIGDLRLLAERALEPPSEAEPKLVTLMRECLTNDIDALSMLEGKILVCLLCHSRGITGMTWLGF